MGQPESVNMGQPESIETSLPKTNAAAFEELVAKEEPVDKGGATKEVNEKANVVSRQVLEEKPLMPSLQPLSPHKVVSLTTPENQEVSPKPPESAGSLPSPSSPHPFRL